MHADLLIYNGKCYDPDTNEIYNWIAVKEDRIIDFGIGTQYEQYYLDSDQAIDAGKATVLPGFIDCNSHVVQTAINSESLDLSKAASFDEIGVLIASYAKNNPGQLIRGVHLDELNLKEKRLPDRYLLDNYCANTPVWISRIDCHTSILNTCALLQFKMPYSIDGIAQGDDHKPTGIFSGKANALLRERILNDVEDQYKLWALKRLFPKLIKLGVTTIATMEGGYMFCDRDAEFMQKYQNALPLDIALYYQTTDINKLKIMGIKKIGNLVVDGSFGSRSAAIQEPYVDQTKCTGSLYFSQNELNSFLEDCYRNGIQTAIHAIGERAIDLVLNAHEFAYKRTGYLGGRHRLEHVELPTPSQLERSRNLSLIYSMMPAYEFFWGGPGKMYEQRLGERYRLTNPFREILDARIRICGGSDSDITPINPLLGIHAAVNHPIETHRVTIQEAIRMFTTDAAYAINEEQIKGSIAIGKMADLIILNEDVLNVKSDEIIHVKIKTTIKSGNVLMNQIGCGGE